jgi:hypothetical protein
MLGLTQRCAGPFCVYDGIGELESEKNEQKESQIAFFMK